MKSGVMQLGNQTLLKQQFTFLQCVRTYVSTCYILQWNPSKPATLATSENVLIRGVATFQG